MFSQCTNYKFATSVPPLIAWSTILKVCPVIISPLSAGTMSSFVTRGKGQILKKEGVSLLVSSPLFWVGFHGTAWSMQHQALHLWLLLGPAPITHMASPAVSMASPLPGSSSLSGFSNTWPLESRRQQLQCTAASSAQREAAFSRTSSGDFRVECYRPSTSR